MVAKRVACISNPADLLTLSDDLSRGNIYVGQMGINRSIRLAVNVMDDHDVVAKSAATRMIFLTHTTAGHNGTDHSGSYCDYRCAFRCSNIDSFMVWAMRRSKWVSYFTYSRSDEFSIPYVHNCMI